MVVDELSKVRAAGGRRRPVSPDAPRRDVAVEVRGIRRSFGAELVLDGVDVSVERGTVHALIGPNGAGKSTLLRVVAGLVRPDAGVVGVLGRDVASAGRSARADVGFMPSGERSFYLRISALENLVFFARLHGLRRRQAVACSREALASVGLEAEERKRVGAFSTGMQRRLALARALMLDPPVLLLDEASHDLDPDGAELVRNLVHDASGRGAAVLWATQRLGELGGFADRVTLLDGGHVLHAGTVASLVARARTRRFVVDLRDSSRRGRVLLEVLRAAVGAAAAIAPGDEPGTWVVEPGEGQVLGSALGAIAAAGVDVLSCRDERSPLEAAFVEAVGA